MIHCSSPIPTLPVSPDQRPQGAEATLTFLGRAGAANPKFVRVGDFLTIGSDPSSGCRVQDPTVSPRHARIERRGEGWTIRDMQSNTGVFLNEIRITDAPLGNLDRIRVGEVVFLFRDRDDSNSAPTSKNEAWGEQLDRLPSFAATDFPVLLMGPSGSGKEVLARAVHQLSKRRSGPFLAVNCSALSESLIESELFGHVRGSFTGATHDRKGAFEAARGGTLFLDEIGDLPLSLQPKLLRAIENKEIRPVGSDRTNDTDVRIVVATHKNLLQHVQLGQFREDLYWRLNVCQMAPPLLIERMEDFTDLVYHFCKQMRVRLSHNSIEALRNHSWPGNIRELRNVISRAAAYYPGHYIQPDDVARLLEPKPLAPEAMHLAEPLRPEMGPASGNIMREIEREMIIRRLVANRGNQRKTATDLGMPKSTLHDRLKTYSIDLNQIKST